MSIPSGKSRLGFPYTPLASGNHKQRCRQSVFSNAGKGISVNGHPGQTARQFSSGTSILTDRRKFSVLVSALSSQRKFRLFQPDTHISPTLFNGQTPYFHFSMPCSEQPIPSRIDAKTVDMTFTLNPMRLNGWSLF